MGIFETHAHYEDSVYDESRDTLLSSMQKSGIEFILNAGADPEDLPIATAIAEKYSFIYLSVGAHPHYAPKMTEEFLAYFTKMTEHEKVVAIGEIGLDYHYDGHDPNVQKYWFSRQLDLADKHNLPIIVHSRDADDDMFEILNNRCSSANVTPLLSGRNERRGVLHCFSQNLKRAEKYVEMGFYIGIGGVVTYKNAKTLTEVAEGIPLERILLETDCPYLSPVPLRGTVNNSQNLTYITEKISQIKQIPPEKVIEVTRKNAMSLFGVK